MTTTVVDLEWQRRRATRLLTVAQGAAFAVSGIVVALGPLTLLGLSGTGGMAGLLLGLVTLSGGVGAYLAGHLMDRIGARAPLIAAHALAGIGGVAAALASSAGSATGVLAAVVPLSAGQGAALLGRLAVAGIHPPAERGRQLGRLVSAGTAGALGGPALVAGLGALAEATGLNPLSLPWLAIPALAATGAVAVAAVNLGPHLRAGHNESAPVARPAAGRRGIPPRLAVTAVSGAQATMVAAMAAGPVMVHGHTGSDGAVTAVVGLHLAGMYALAPVIGRLIDGSGQRAGILAGSIACVGGSLLIPLAHEPVLAGVALLSVGFGWSASYMASTAALGRRPDGGRATGAADLAAAGAGAGAALVGGLLVQLGSLPVLAVCLAAPGAVVLFLATPTRTHRASTSSVPAGAA